MKRCSVVLALLSALPLAVTARSLHVDITHNDDVTIDVDMEDVRVSPSAPKNHRKTLLRDEKDNQVKLYYETHQGFETKSGKYMNFSNIPYAEPPLKDFRWMPPIFPEKESDKLNDGSRRAICPQFQAGWAPTALNFVHDMLADPVLDKKWKDHIDPEDYEGYGTKPELHPDSSEDCLTLDVLVPKRVWESRNSNKIRGAAVLVWIHGGGFIFGSKDQFGSPEQLLDESIQGDDTDGIIFVSINYRLGAFGWLGGSKFYDDSGVANVGLHDQKLAFEWVRENIHLFGGDSRRVTAMGQSAGASSIMHHITSSERVPLFKSAIIQSPAFFPSPDPNIHNEVYKRFLKSAGVKNFDELIAADTKTLMDANADLSFNSSYGIFNFGPTVDFDYVPDLPSKRLQQGRHHKGISLLVGHTKVDGLLFTPPWVRNNPELRDHVRTMFPSIPDDVLDKVDELYPIRKEALAKERVLDVSNFLDDIAIQCNSHYLTQAMINHPGPGFPAAVYRYAFNIVPALHGADIPYTFNPSIDMGLPLYKDVAKFWQGSIANFTLYLDPNDEDSEAWPNYKSDNQKVLNIGKPSQWILPNHHISVEKDTLRFEKCDYWQSAPYYMEPKKKTSSHGSSRAHPGQERMEM